MSTKLGSTDDDGAAAVVTATVREEHQQIWNGSKSKIDRRRGWVLMLLLPEGQLGWIRSDGNYPWVIIE